MPVIAHSFGELSPSRQALVRRMQRLGFGRFEGLLIREGDPVLDDPELRIFHEFKLGNVDTDASDGCGDDFRLKAQVVDLFARFDQLREARIETLSVKHGLPFCCSVEAQSETAA